MRKHHGQEGRLYIGVGTAIGESLCSLSSFSINQEREQVEVTSFCDANKTYVQGKPDLTGDLAGFWDSENDVLFDAQESPDPVMIVAYPSINVPDQYWYGLSWINTSLTVDVGDATKISGSFSAAGSWTRVHPGTP